MPDWLDHAQGTESKFTEVALANQLQRSRQHVEKETREECAECGEPIPQARREAQPGCQLCIIAK